MINLPFLRPGNSLTHCRKERKRNKRRGKGKRRKRGGRGEGGGREKGRGGERGGGEEELKYFSYNSLIGSPAI